MKQQSRRNRQSTSELLSPKDSTAITANVALRKIEISTGNGMRLAGKYLQLMQSVNNITQGLLLFDENHDIILCNERYIEMFFLSRDIVKPGCTLMTLLQHRQEAGQLKGDLDEYYEDLLAINKRGTTTSKEITTTDGRTIHMVNTPLSVGGVITFEDVTEQKCSEAQIKHMAQHDALTDLPNRLLFQARLEHALRWNEREPKVAVLFIDLDNFKNINDTMGHQVGDELLKIVATRLRECVREPDAVARLGGDEFVVLHTNNATPAIAAQLATRIREAITAPCKIADNQIVIDTNIGIAISPTDGTTPELLIKNAALYGSKASGRGTYQFFEREMDVRMAARHAL